MEDLDDWEEFDSNFEQFMVFRMEDVPNFDIGWDELLQDISQEGEERINFDIGWEEFLEESMEDDDLNISQEGGGDDENFVIENMSEFHISKFQVRGYEYTIRLNAIEEESSYLQAVQVVHRTIQRKFVFFCFVF